MLINCIFANKILFLLPKVWRIRNFLIQIRIPLCFFGTGTKSYLLRWVRKFFITQKGKISTRNLFTLFHSSKSDPDKNRPDPQHWLWHPIYSDLWRPWSWPRPLPRSPHSHCRDAALATVSSPLPIRQSRQLTHIITSSLMFNFCKMNEGLG